MKKKNKQYAIQFQNERPFISLDRETFRKTDEEKGQLLTMKKELGKSKRHKFQTFVVAQY